MPEQYNIPVPPPEMFKSKGNNTDILNITRAQQNEAPLLLIEHIVGAGVEFAQIQLLQNSKGEVGIFTIFEDRPCVKVGVEIKGLTGDWAQDKITGSKITYVPIGLFPNPPEPEGWFTYYKGLKYPRKGWVTPYSAKAIYSPKRGLINVAKTLATKDLILPYLGLAILPKRIKIRILERFLKNYTNFAVLTMGEFYWEEKYRMRIAKTIHRFIQIFLTGLGVSEDTSYNFGETISYFIEYDDAYRYRLEDVMSETDKQRMLAVPITETKRLLELYLKREGSGHVAQSMKLLGKLVSLILRIPYVRQAFKEALGAIEFKDLQLDEMDHYHVSRLGGYNFFGETIEERLKKYEPNEGVVIPIP